MNKKVVHFHPLLCNVFYESYKEGDIIDATTELNNVTCPKCIYYYFRPEAKALENAYQAGKL